tara:strand:+ start:717 stop:1391 length:675 start_codon:yes stop_codon:yes gene_type:complete
MKVEINVPDSLKEITLDQYQRFEKLNTEENKESTFLLQKMVEIFCNLNLKDVANIKYKSVQEIVVHLNKIFDQKHSLVPTFSLGNVEYGFIPVLDDMSLGEFIDLDENLGKWDNMHKAMSVLYRPVKFKKDKKYNIEDYDGMNDKLKYMPLNIVFGSMVFFYNLSNELTQTILNYLQKELPNKLTIQQKEALDQSGVGINRSMVLLKEMLPSLTRLPSLTSTSV